MNQKLLIVLFIMSMFLNDQLNACVQWASPDFTQDGLVDVSDLVYLIGKYGTSCDDCCRGDINRDGFIDNLDLIILLGEFGSYDVKTFETCRMSTEIDSPPCG